MSSTLGPEMPEADRRVVADTGIRALLAKNFAEALRRIGRRAGSTTRSRSARPWGFNLSDIRVPVLLWHGENDVFSPAAHARWLADGSRTRNCGSGLIPRTSGPSRWCRTCCPG